MSPYSAAVKEESDLGRSLQGHSRRSAIVGQGILGYDVLIISQTSASIGKFKSRTTIVLSYKNVRAIIK